MSLQNIDVMNFGDSNCLKIKFLTDLKFQISPKFKLWLVKSGQNSNFSLWTYPKLQFGQNKGKKIFRHAEYESARRD